MKDLKFYWIRFYNPPDYNPISLGCGITAFSYNDAMQLAQNMLSKQNLNLDIMSVEEGVDILSLDAGHVIPNIGLTTERGVWFPKGH
jgi:hypothetical protein